MCTTLVDIVGAAVMNGAAVETLIAEIAKANPRSRTEAILCIFILQLGAATLNSAFTFK